MSYFYDSELQSLKNTVEKWTKDCTLLFLKKSDLEIIKNYGGIALTARAAKVYNALILNRIQREIEKIFRNTNNLSNSAFVETPYNLTDSANRSSRRRNMNKESWSNSTVRRFLKNIWFHSQKKDWANTTCI